MPNFLGSHLLETYHARGTKRVYPPALPQLKILNQGSNYPFPGETAKTAPPRAARRTLSSTLQHGALINRALRTEKTGGNSCARRLIALLSSARSRLLYIHVHPGSEGVYIESRVQNTEATRRSTGARSRSPPAGTRLISKGVCERPSSQFSPNAPAREESRSSLCSQPHRVYMPCTRTWPRLLSAAAARIAPK